MFSKLFQRTHAVRHLPIVILMPHSRCNCRCIMCDIWKDNSNARSLSDRRIEWLLDGLQRLRTTWVVLSGGEALLYPPLFELCRRLKERGIKTTLLSTGLLLNRHSSKIVDTIDEVIVSLDGPEPVHEAIRRVPGAFRRMAEGIESMHKLRADYPVYGRCVIQKGNFRHLPAIVDAARTIGLRSISFLPADVSSDAFNHKEPLSEESRTDIVPAPEETVALRRIVEDLVDTHRGDFATGFIVESPDKLRRIVTYYGALNGLNDFPPVRCNAPWVSAVIEADGNVRPCFFHPVYASMDEHSDLSSLLNDPRSSRFRQQLVVKSDPICQRCVCFLNYRAST